MVVMMISDSGRWWRWGWINAPYTLLLLLLLVVVLLLQQLLHLSNVHELLQLGALAAVPRRRAGPDANHLLRRSLRDGGGAREGVALLMQVLEIGQWIVGLVIASTVSARRVFPSHRERQHLSPWAHNSERYHTALFHYYYYYYSLSHSGGPFGLTHTCVLRARPPGEERGFLIILLVMGLRGTCHAPLMSALVAVAGLILLFYFIF